MCLSVVPRSRRQQQLLRCGGSTRIATVSAAATAAVPTALDNHCIRSYISSVRKHTAATAAVEQEHLSQHQQQCRRRRQRPRPMAEPSPRIAAAAVSSFWIDSLSSIRHAHQHQQQQQQRRLLSAHSTTATATTATAATPSTPTLTTVLSTTTTLPPPPPISHHPPLPPHRLFRYLQLETFARSELERVYDRIALVDTVSEELETSMAVLDHAALVQYMIPQLVRLEQEKNNRTTTNDNNATAEQQLSVEAQRLQYAHREATRILELLLPDEGDRQLKTQQQQLQQQQRLSIPKAAFCDRVTALATAVDHRRTAPIFLSMLLVGASVGVINPAMPFVVQTLHLSAAQYGGIVSAFGLAKMLGNVPAAVAVERHGRKPYMTYSLAVIAGGVGGIGLAGSFEELYACRLITGLGVAALSTAGTLMIADLSTPLNRASTYAPIMSAFAAGTALGPAIGGLLVDQLGLQMTFYAVGASFFGVALVNRVILSETKSTFLEFPWQKKPARTVHTHHNKDQLESTSATTAAGSSNTTSVGQAMQDAVGQWVPLLRDPSVRSVIIMNGIYWIAIAGSQMTLMPLMLTTDVASGGLAFSATQVGQVYMGMSLVQIFGNPIFAKVSDTVGKVPVIVAATTFIGASMYAFPLCCGETGQLSLWPLAATLGVWSMGSSMLSTAPLAFVSDRVDESKRAQAIALLRTSGDVGFLVGAAGTGVLADGFAGSLTAAMHMTSGLMLTATTWFAIRQYLTVQLERSKAVIDDAGTSEDGPHQR